MFKNINKFFFDLTKRNWGAPWHYIISCLVTIIFIRIMGIKNVWEWYFGIYTLVLIFVASGYEVWQLSQKNETRQGAVEDLIMAIFGYLTATIFLWGDSWYYLVHLAIIPLFVPQRNRLLICLDPGHGGKFPGAVSAGVKEANVNFRYVHRLSSLLRLHFDIIWTRISDNHLSHILSKDLIKRAEIANENEADLFISVHCNASEDPGAHGFEIWTSRGETDADRFADSVFNSVSKLIPELALRIDLSDGDTDKEADFAVLRKTRMPAILLELGFLSNEKEREQLLSFIYTERLSKAIAQGIYEAFNVFDT